MTAIAILKKTEILAEIAKGRFLTAIAKDLGITHAAISQQLAADPEYKAARVAGVEKRLEEQWGNLESAEDPLTLARARETWKAATWFAEREFPERWGGAKVQVNVNVNSQLDARLSDPIGNVIDQLPGVKDSGD